MPIHIPTRTEIVVLGPDDPNQRKIGLVVCEREGGEVFLFEEGREYKPGPNGRLDLEPILSQDVLKPGVKVLVPFITGGYHRMTVVKDSYGVLYAENYDDEGKPVLSANLVFDADDRHCWTSSLTMNLRGLKKLGLKTT